VFDLKTLRPFTIGNVSSTTKTVEIHPLASVCYDKNVETQHQQLKKGKLPGNRNPQTTIATGRMLLEVEEGLYAHLNRINNQRY
jgi:hypothetical protein